MMYNCYHMTGGYGGGGLMLLGWLTYILGVTLVVLAIIALWKYINKK